MTQQKAPIHVLRGILRLSKSPQLPQELVRKGLTTPGFPNALQRFVLQRYRQHQEESCEQTRTVLHETALNYYHMKCDLVERGRLYKLDGGAETIVGGSEMSRRAAAKVGLQLPKLNPEFEQ